MADQGIRIEGQPIASWGSANPAIINAYVYSIGEIPGVVAANNFLSIFNPAASGKTFALGGVFISSYAVGDISATVESIRGFRITAASAGTLVSNTTICKFDNTKPDSALEVRTGNPTVTLGNAFFNSPPFIGSVKSSFPFVHQVPTLPGSGPFIFRPGEGLVIRTNAGDVDTRWNISASWSEM